MSGNLDKILAGIKNRTAENPRVRKRSSDKQKLWIKTQKGKESLKRVQAKRCRN